LTRRKEKGEWESLSLHKRGSREGAETFAGGKEGDEKLKGGGYEVRRNRRRIGKKKGQKKMEKFLVSLDGKKEPFGKEISQLQAGNPSAR